MKPKVRLVSKYMTNKWVNSAILVIIIVSILLIYKNQNQNIESIENITPLPSRKVYIGAWTGGFWDNETKTLDTSTLIRFENSIEKKTAIANIYSEWAYLSNKELVSVLNEISRNDWTPMISSNPYFFEGCPEKNKSLYETIAVGDCDEFLKAVAINLRSYEKPIFLRFAWEMNLPDMYWSVTKVKSSPRDFINAWKRFHDILQEEKATNVIWVLSFNTSNSGTIPYADLYPGDNYTDWVAIDGYNWGDSQDWSGWTNFNGVFRKSYDELLAITSKPVMLSEVNSSPSGGNKAEWLQDMLNVQIPNNFSNVGAIVFFNEDKIKGESVDWTMEKSPDYISALKNSLDSEHYKSVYP